MNKKPTRMSELIFGYVKIHKLRVTVFSLCTLVSACSDIIAPLFIGNIIDSFSAGGTGYKIIILLSVYAVGGLSKFLCSALTAKSVYDMSSELRTWGFESLSRLPVSFFDKTGRGDVASRFVNDVEILSDGMISAAVQLLYSAFIVLFTLVIMLVISPIVTMAVLAVTVLNFVAMNRITRFTSKYFSKTQKELGELSAISEETVSMYRVVRGFGYTDTAKSKFAAANSQHGEALFKSQFGGAVVNPLSRLLGHIAYVAVAVVGCAAAGLSAGVLSSFVIYAAQFSRPFNEITGIWANIMAAKAGAARMFSILNMPPEENGSLPAPQKGDIVFENVRFSYSNEPLIENFNLTVKKGQHIAIVGPTGAGKTTIINLLMRFYDVSGGSIKIGGTDIKELDRDEHRARFSMVLQDTWLFEGTVADNIRYGTDADIAKIKKAAELSFADRFIETLPKGYDTVIGDGADGASSGLSEGQNQLLTIARAMLRSPEDDESGSSVLILDEATSSVDTLTEQHIKAAFDRLMQGKTCFIIAHRLSTVKNADCILVLDGGKVVEQGTHTELIELGGLYQKMYNESV